jgi:iron(III) transport system substrate-binding protein
MAAEGKSGSWIWAVVALVAVVAVTLVLSKRGPEPLTVYCAHDSVYAEAILKQFEADTGIPLAVKYDTEATKSLGLIELLIREKDAPRCDVFWNNEILGTLDLQDRDVLEPYKGAGWERIPASFKDPEGYWTGFGARLRVYIVNTEQMAPEPAAVEKLLEAEDLSRVAIAKPLYGTTLTQYSVLWHRWGGEKLKAWHAELRERGIREVASNGESKECVAEGICTVGYTDTDDFFVAKDNGKPVAALPVRLAGGRTICIPNTAAIIKGTDQQETARKLVDYLLSRKTELALSRSASRQIPLGDIGEEELPEEVLELQPWAADGVDLNGLLPARNACLEWLKAEYRD